MTELTEPKTAAIVERYVAVWNEPDPAARRAAVAELWAPDGTEFVDGGTQHREHEELLDMVAEAHEAFVASGRFTTTGAGDVTRHDDIVTFTVQLTAPGGVVGWAARVFLLLGADELIQESYRLTVQPLAAWCRASALLTGPSCSIATGVPGTAQRRPAVLRPELAAKSLRLGSVWATGYRRGRMAWSTGAIPAWAG